MRSTMPQDQLTRLITRYSRAAQEARQVAGRLAQLLDVRFTEIKRDHVRGVSGAEGTKGADAVRKALVDPRWLQTVDELVDLHARAYEQLTRPVRDASNAARSAAQHAGVRDETVTRPAKSASRETATPTFVAHEPSAQLAAA